MSAKWEERALVNVPLPIIRSRSRITWVSLARYMTAIFGSLNRSGPNFMTVVSEGLLGYLTITCWLLVQLHVALQVEVTVCLHCCIS